MSLIYFHGEQLMPFLLLLYALAVIGLTAIVYILIKFWQSRKKKK